MAHVLVTGASGFVGGALVPHLAQRGFAVTAVARTPRSAPDRPVRHAHRSVTREVGPTTEWRDLLRGVDVVVHLAARVHMMGSEAANASAYRAVNAAGTANLARQAAEAGVRRFVFVSTVKVHGEASPGRAIREADPLAPVDAYAVSKAEAEQALGAIARETGLETVVIRPPLVYGPGVRANFLRLMQAVARGTPLPLGRVRNRRSMVYLGNLVSALEQCIVDERAAGESFLVCDGPAVSTADLVRTIAAAMGRSARLVGVPAAVLRIGGALTGRSDVVRRLVDSFEVDGSRISRVMGWQPAFTMEEGVAETVRWFQGRFRQ